MKLGRREKILGQGRAVPLDRNAKVRVMAYARGWSARNCRPGQHRGPITRAFLVHRFHGTTPITPPASSYRSRYGRQARG